jgi:hypothetical protein
LSDSANKEQVLAGLYITSLHPGGHFRAGVKHPDERAFHGPKIFTCDQIEVLTNDPRLQVELVFETREEETGESGIPPSGSAPEGGEAPAESDAAPSSGEDAEIEETPPNGLKPAADSRPDQPPAAAHPSKGRRK